MSKNVKLNDEEVYALKDIITENPNYYLDESALALLIRCGKFIHYSTLCQIRQIIFQVTIRSMD